MNTKSVDIMMRGSAFAWLALATGVLLLIPLIAMQITAEVNWDKVDFVAMGVLLFGMGSLFVLLARKMRRRYRWVIGGLVAVAFFFVWAELSVGVFTNLGS